MDVFPALGHEYEQIVYGHNPSAGLKTIIAVFSTARGPALGGTRIYPYPTEQAALTDVLRLGKAMAYKAACADLPLGGGKAVIIADPHTDKTPELLRAYGKVVHGLGGSYLTSADVGSTQADLDVIAEMTPYVTGTSKGAGDPSPVTAYGVWHGMRAVAEAAFGEPTMKGRHVAIQGVGKVGASLARMLAEEGARLTISDVETDAVKALAVELGAAIAEPADVYDVVCDVFAPCAMGSVIDEQTIGRLTCKAIAGAANNVLASPEFGHALTERGIVYAPDYVINAGGLMNVEDELHGYDPERVHRKAERIPETLREVFSIAKAQGISTSEAADHIAQERIAAATRA